MLRTQLPTLLLAWMAATAGFARAEPMDYTGYRQVLVDVTSRADLATLDELSHTILPCFPQLGPVSAIVAPGGLADLQQSGLAFRILHDNIQELVELERTPGLRGTWDAYMDLAQIVAFINGLAAARPDLCEVFSIGTSIEGRDIWVLHITGTSGSKPAVFYHALQHSREWITGPVVLYLADHLVNNYDTDPNVAALVDGLDIYLAPCVNPDGYVYTWESARLWRKNRRDNGDSFFGVDLNRNWGHQWGFDDLGSSPYKWDDTYRGPSAFSEPETQALSNFIAATPNIVAYVDYHNFSQLILWPWGYQCLGGPPEPEASTFSALGTAMQTQISSVYGRDYTPGPLCETIGYSANGSSADWVFGVQGRVAFTIELRPLTSLPGFELPPSEILPTCQENLAASLYLSEWALAQAGVHLSFPDGLPDLIAPGVAKVIDVQVVALGESLIPGSPTLHYRYDGGAFQAAPLTYVSGDLYQATLPASACSATPEYYFSAAGDASGTVNEPSGAPGQLYTTTVGQYVTLFGDNFETDQGWTAVNLGATSGDWQRGQPVNDPAWDYDPAADADGSGQCYLTENRPGNSDVDNGAVRLISPAIDMSAGDITISYDYFLRLTDTTGGVDHLLVEIDSNNGAGPWIEIARHNSDGGLSWRHDDISQAELDAAGVTLTPTMKLRFDTNDAGASSINESGLDAFRVTTIGCLPGSICDVVEVRSCRDHGPAGRLCLALAADGGIEPRRGGLTELEIDLLDAANFAGGVTVTCLQAGDVSASVTGSLVNGNTVRLTLDPALPDADACSVELDCGASVCLRSLSGDLNRDASVNPVDTGQLLLRFGLPADNSNAVWDYNRDGAINPIDANQLVLVFGNGAPTCP